MNELTKACVSERGWRGCFGVWVLLGVKVRLRRGTCLVCMERMEPVIGSGQCF